MKLKMCVRLLIAAAVVIFTAVSELPLAAEAVFLKDGSIVNGTIETDSADAVTLRLSDKKLKRILRKDIMRILYTELKMTKIYIQKRDGDGLVAYMVDEDRVSYTFRKDLYQPVEFVLNRNDVLFISEKNPSGLKVDGEIETDRVSLKWLPPYDDVKKYNIYMTKSKSGKYEVIDSTTDKTITLKNLTSNTAYYVIVTSVDRSDYESSPSNELKIITANIPPAEPVVTSSDDIRKDERKITWSASADPDGKVEKYRVYGTKDDKREMIAETKKTEYILTKASTYKKVKVAAVDDRGDESGLVKKRKTGNTVLGLYPGLFIPFGKLGEMYDTGFGGMLTLTRRNLFINGIEAGIGAGFYYAEGKDLRKEQKSLYHESIMAPLLVNAGYRFEFWDGFSIAPSLSMGFTYIRMTYMTLTPIYEKIESTENIVDPTVKCGLNIGYSITDLISVSLTGEYGMFIETGGSIPFVTAGIGVELRF